MPNETGDMNTANNVNQDAAQQLNTATETPIPVTGKNAEAVQKLASLPKPFVMMREVQFNFKTPRSDDKAPEFLDQAKTQKNPNAGKPVDKLGNVLEKRASLKLNLPIPTFDGLIEALGDERQLAYVMSLIEEDIINQARLQVGDETTPVDSQDKLDLSKLTLTFLANQPKAERRGGGIAKEVWEAFGKDYIETMPAVSGKTAEQVGNQAKILLAKFQPAKSQKQVLGYLREQLALWFKSTNNAEEFAECYEFLDAKADAFLKMDESALLASL